MVLGDEVEHKTNALYDYEEINKYLKKKKNSNFYVLAYIWKHSGSVGLIGGMHLLMTPIAPLIAASTKSQVTL